MEATQQREKTEAPAVLGYTAQVGQQKRLERGIMWLVGIICAAQLLMLPIGVCYWLVYFPYYHFNFSQKYYWDALVALLQTVGALVTAVFGLLFLLGIQRARGIFVVGAWVICLLSVFHFLIYLWFCRSFLYFTSWQVRDTVAAFTQMVIWCYPVMLAAIAMKSPQMKRRYAQGWILWSITATAAVAVAMQTIVSFSLDLESVWLEHAAAVFAATWDGPWHETPTGIGMIAGAMASCSAIGAVAWSFYRGVSGRWALMICAALWVVFAGGVFGTELLREIESLRLRGLRAFPPAMANDLWGSLQALSTLAAYLAFPLAIRVALTLSDVRAKLERTPRDMSSEA
jgi:hypothetical protein